MFTYLSDNSIRKICPNQIDSHYQPMTLDFACSKMSVFDDEVRNRINQSLSQNPFSEDNFDNLGKEYSKEKVIIPPHAYVDGYIDPKIINRSRNYLWNVRSSRGRWGLRPDAPIIRYENSNEPYISFINHNPNTLQFPLGKQFAQLFFLPQIGEKTDTYDVTNEEEVREIAKSCGNNIETQGNLVIFRMGGKVQTYNKLPYIIDLENKPSDEELFTTTTDLKEGFLQRRNECCIMSLEPRLQLPEDVGIRLFQRIPVRQKQGLRKPDSDMLFIQNYSNHAIWVDQGYEGNITAHPLALKFDRFYDPNEMISVGVFVKGKVSRKYGSKELNSHYQGSDGSASKD